MRIDRINRARRRATAIAETAIVLPFLFLLIFGVWEVGQLVHVSQMVNNSAREGARLAATGLYSSSSIASLSTTNTITTFGGPYLQVQTAVGNYLQNAGLALSNSNTTAPCLVTVTNEKRNYSCQVQVSPPSSGSSVTASATITQIGANPTADPTTDSTVLQFDTLRIDVQYPFTFARWSPNNLFFYLGATPNIYATVRWPCMRDQPLVLDTSIPNQPLSQ